ncbi:MAG: sel1 repeat family protein [Nitrospira sp.]|nr:sel1 repeat family protein [Nitrospira sp.]
MTLARTFILVLSLIGLVVPAWADFQAGRDAAKRGDYTTALREFRSQAKLGDAKAQWSLGMMYANGQGEPQDYVQAHMWFSLAAANGVKRVAELRDALAKKMIPAKLAEAQQLAREWKPKTP